ncbi:MAG: hypothetical protein DLM61_12170 [Pseudonocardiales bacterium]|nr:MAG: hypothetical protein DLM61_12170 [Pseudonocardiales bacterium]
MAQIVSAMWSAPLAQDPGTGAAPPAPASGSVRRGWWRCQSSIEIRWPAPDAAHATSAVDAALVGWRCYRAVACRHHDTIAAPATAR